MPNRLEPCNYITVISHEPKPSVIRLFIQQLVQGNIKQNTKGSYY